MERAMSVEERIRRAEDIYNRRNGVYTRTQTINSKTKNTNKKRTAKRLLMQIFVCLSIYVIFYAVTNREYIFSEEFRNSVNTFFTEKINTYEMYSKVKNLVLSFFEDEEDSAEVRDDEKSNTADEQSQTEQSQGENKADTNQQENSQENHEEKQGKTQENEQVKNIKDENIGGAEESTEAVNEDKKKNEKLTEQEQMEKEAKEIKKKISFIAPVKGRISSTFGWRTPTTASVPKYHTGVDIATVEGTKIKSATDGKVIMASSTGDYGNHYQIQIQDVILVYAHCKKLYLKEGDIVKKGQEIAEVGSTGNSTGPHLHFEIRKAGMKIDPQLVLDL